MRKMNGNGLRMMGNGMGMHCEDDHRCMEILLAILEHLVTKCGKLNVDFP